MDAMARSLSQWQPVHWHRQSHVERNNFHISDRQRMIGQSACLSPIWEKFIVRQVLIDNRTNVRYNYCVATLGKMLNRNSNKSVFGQFDFPFGWPL